MTYTDGQMAMADLSNEWQLLVMVDSYSLILTVNASGFHSSCWCAVHRYTYISKNNDNNQK